MGRVQEITDSLAWRNQLAESNSTKKPMIVDFTASWCGPCQMMAPVFERLSATYTNVTFLKVDVDKLQDVAQACGVTAMPTFQLFSGGECVGSVLGADPPALTALVEKHHNLFKPVFSGQSRTLNDAGPRAADAAAAARGGLVPGVSPPAASVVSASASTGADESQPMSTVQIRLADGSRLTGSFNHTQTVGDLRRYISACTSISPAAFQLVTSYPTKALTDDAIILQQAGVLNALITQRMV